MADAAEEYAEAPIAAAAREDGMVRVVEAAAATRKEAVACVDKNLLNMMTNGWMMTLLR